MINFTLKKIDNISPVGQPENLYLSWFWLTDGELWIELDNTILYEYTEEAIKNFGNKISPYNDYYLVRFIEDFSNLFNQISENIPKAIFDLSSDILSFDNNAQQWLDLHETDDDVYSDFYFEEYEKLTSWRWNRNLNSGHLIGGPNISFYRHKDKIRIVWQTDGVLENGIQIWKSESGYQDILYDKFVMEIQKFKDKFFETMFEQVKYATKKDWKEIRLDKGRLMQEHFEREKDFQSELDFLKTGGTTNSDWEAIEQLLSKMNSEINDESITSHED